MTPNPSTRLQHLPTSATVRIADTVSAMRSSGHDILDFSAGRAMEHTPAYIGEAGARAIAGGDTHQTMAQGTPAFRAACVRKLARENAIEADPDDHIVATMGCKEGLFLALLATIDPGGEVIVEDPCFVSYQPAIRLGGAVPVPVPLRAEHGFRWRAADLEDAVTNRTRAIVLCSPHNPTGVVHTETDLEVIAAVARRHDLFVLTDETYERLTWREHRHTSIATLPGMAERTITVMGVTKSFSMGGWRVGFNHARADLVATMVTLQQHLVTCASSIGQAAGAAALREPPRAEVRALWDDWERRCDHVVDTVNDWSETTCHRPEGGFYAWIDVSRVGPSSVTIADRLLREFHVALVPGAAFGPHGEGFLRMTCVKSWDDLRAGLSRLGDGLSAIAAAPTLTGHS